MINKHNPILNGDLDLDENVRPLRSFKDIRMFQRYWLNRPRLGGRNWMIFKLGIVTGLRASDLTRLQTKQVYDPNGNPRKYIKGEKDKKTGKVNHYLYIVQAKNDLNAYKKWRNQHNFNSQWMFPSFYHRKTQHIKVHTLYHVMRYTGSALGFKHIGTHSIRKTFGYFAYKQTGNIVYVMRRLNQSSPTVTLRYIGIDRHNMESISSKLKF